MKKQKKENNLIKENEKMNGQPMALSDEDLEQVSGDQTREIILDGDECRPYYTGQQKQVETSGRVDKFNERFG